MRPAYAILILAIFLCSACSQNEKPLPAPAALPPRPDLPDPLVMMDGSAVKDSNQWFKERRPELKRLFQHYMYGQIPPRPGVISSSVEAMDGSLFNGKATGRSITIQLDNPAGPPIHLLLITPNNVKGKSPVFLGINFRGNHAVIPDKFVPLPTTWLPAFGPEVKDNRATDAGRGTEVKTWNAEKIIDHGYALATFYHGDIDSDSAKPTGNPPRFYERAGEAPHPEDTATIAAWAWGFHRCVDYLVRAPEIDKSKIICVGHSRNGKTALLAGAMDERIAIAIPHQAGCGGTAPSRGKVGEQVRQINKGFPHWFDGNFKEFNEAVEKLPFDQHCLAALMAPRPVLFSNAQEDQWANPAGQFEMLVAADPVYRMLGVEGISTKTMPELNKLVDSRLGFYIRPGKHSMNEQDWDVFIAFADKHLKGK